MQQPDNQGQQTRSHLIRKLDAITGVAGLSIAEGDTNHPAATEVFDLFDQLQAGSLTADEIRLLMHPAGINGPMLVITGVDYDGHEANCAVTFTHEHIQNIGRFYLARCLQDPDEAERFMRTIMQLDEADQIIGNMNDEDI